MKKPILGPAIANVNFDLKAGIPEGRKEVLEPQRRLRWDNKDGYYLMNYE